MTIKTKPTGIRGLADVDVSTNPRKFSFIDIYFGGACDLDCKYCFTNHHKGKLTTDDRKKILTEAKKLGVKTFVCTGAGEPLIDSGFKEVVKHAHKLGLTSVIYTNAQHIDEKMAKFFFENDVSPLIKLESLNKKVHDEITQTKGSHKKAISAIENLISAGYGKVKENGLTRIGVAAVYTALNINDLSELQKVCNEKGLLLMVDELGLEKKAYENKDLLFVPKYEIDEIKKELRILESGVQACSCSNIATCLYSEYGIRIDQDGNVSYCTMQDTGNIIANVRDTGLEKAVEFVKVANRVAQREKFKTLEQVNNTLANKNIPYQIKLPKNTCPFKAGDNLELVDLQ